jgi:hypothetical protein
MLAFGVGTAFALGTRGITRRTISAGCFAAFAERLAFGARRFAGRITARSPFTGCIARLVAVARAIGFAAGFAITGTCGFAETLTVRCALDLRATLPIARAVHIARGLAVTRAIQSGRTLAVARAFGFGSALAVAGS